MHLHDRDSVSRTEHKSTARSSAAHESRADRPGTDEVAYQSVLQFWFEESSPAQWWKVDAEFDRLIVERFSELHGRATRSELFEWRAEPRGRLAEIIVLDQFSRNIYRGDALAYANDTLALALAQEAVAARG